MTIYKKPGYRRRNKPRKKKVVEPEFQTAEDILSDSEDTDDSKSFVFGKFDVSGLDLWERTFLANRRRDVAEHFEDPTSKGIAHRWVQSELLLEQLQRKATVALNGDDSKGLNMFLATIDRVEKSVQGLQKELNFLPSQTFEERKAEEIFSNMVIDFRLNKAKYVVGFDKEEEALMMAKGMNVELERKRLSAITGRLSRERARAILVIFLGSMMEVATETFGLGENQAEDLMERLVVRVKSKAPEITPLID